MGIGIAYAERELSPDTSPLYEDFDAWIVQFRDAATASHYWMDWKGMLHRCQSPFSVFRGLTTGSEAVAGLETLTITGDGTTRVVVIDGAKMIVVLGNPGGPIPAASGLPRTVAAEIVRALNWG